MKETDLLGDPLPESRMRRRTMDRYMLTPYRGTLSWPPLDGDDDECDQGPPMRVVMREALVWFLVVASLFSIALLSRT